MAPRNVFETACSSSSINYYGSKVIRTISADPPFPNEGKLPRVRRNFDLCRRLPSLIFFFFLAMLASTYRPGLPPAVALPSLSLLSI